MDAVKRRERRLRWIEDPVAWGIHAWAFIAYATAFPSWVGIPLAGLCVVFGSFTASAIHECGHAMAALACRWQIIVFAVRPFAFQLPNRDLAMLWSGHERGGGGWVAVAPPPNARNPGAAFAFIVIAGPLASLLFAAFALAGWGTVLAQADVGGVPLSHMAFGLGLQTFFSGTFSLIPHRDGRKSDGEYLRLLASGRGPPPETWPAIAVAIRTRHKVRLSRIPDALMEGAWAAAATADARRYLAGTEIGRALDSPPVDAAAARRLIEDYRTEYGTNAWLGACDAYLAAMWEGDGIRAQAALPQAAEMEGLEPLYLAAQAAVAARLGRRSEAEARLVRMEAALLEQSPFRDLTFEDIKHHIETLLDRDDGQAAAPRVSAGPPSRMKRLSQ
jgi:hypothetical protein